jgi:hypothetical protein
MANVVRDPRQHPDAIIPDLSKPDPLVTFTKDDIGFVYGSRWRRAPRSATDFVSGKTNSRSQSKVAMTAARAG